MLSTRRRNQNGVNGNEEMKIMVLVVESNEASSIRSIKYIHY